MRTILIDPTTKTVKVHELPNGELDTLYKTLDCQCVEAINLGSGFTLWIDEEGLLHPKDFFAVVENETCTYVLSGKGLITKCSNGDIAAIPDDISPEDAPIFRFFPDSVKEQIAELADEILHSCGMVHDVAGLEAKRREHSRRMLRAYDMATIKP